MKDGSINTLERLLKPCLPADFMSSAWGKTYKHIRGWQGKFAHLLPWNRLNETLERHRLDFPRLRLALDGKSLPASSYLRYANSARQKTPIPRLLPAELTKQLRRGATLVLDAADELFEPLRELAEGLEYHFHEHVQINLYAGWQTTRGFDLHFDDHDVFILQVTGRKRWSVYGMTKPYPLAQDRAASAKPETNPIWEEMLQDGDLLYIPRGWWHVATPQAEPTLHLTVGVHNRTGVDLLRWMIGRMTKSATFRQDLPRFSSMAEQQAHMNELKQEMLAEWDELLLKRFFDQMDEEAQPRPRLNLPLIAMNERFGLTEHTLVRLTAPRPINFIEEDGVLKFSCNKKRWQFTGEALPLLRALEERRVCSISELCEAANGQLASETVRAFLCELLFHGLVAIVR
jgi:ribosomal protein L16 Arg81 hydroxylase